MAYSEFEQSFMDGYARAEFPGLFEEQPKPEPIQVAAANTGTMTDVAPGGAMDMTGAAGTEPLPELRAYDPTVRERISSFLQAGLEGIGMERSNARRAAQTIMGGQSSGGPLGLGIADIVPFLGTALQTQEAGRNLSNAATLAKQGDIAGAAIEGTMGAVGMIPGAAGTIKAAKPVINATKGMPVGLSIKDVSAPLKKVVPEGQVATTNFKNWFGDWQASPETASKVVDETGAPLAVYHGTQRPDRVGETFKKSRATSGPMAFFTDNTEVASGYAKGKSDTSLAYEDNDYATWFKKKVGRSTLNLDQVGARMSQQERESVIAKLRDINMTDDGEIVYQPGGGTIMTDSSFEYYLKREAGGNPLKAAKQIWLESGTLYNQEEKFDKVLQLAGVKGFDQDFPTSSFPAVYKVYLDIKNPLDTGNIDEYTIAQLEYVANKQRAPRQSGGADMWDKNMRDPKSWIAQLKEDTAAGKSSMAWTSIPDWVTKALKNLGYDGIKDVGGKMGGIKSTVWIPFEETQVKSAIGNRGTFDPTKKNILRGAAVAPAAPAVMQDEEQK